MKNLIKALAFGVLLSGCGMSQKDLRAVDGLLEQAKTANCDTIKQYLAVIQTEVQKKIK